MSLLSKQLEVAAFPGRHSAALEPFLATDVHAVLLEHVDGVHSDLRLVPLHVAGLKEHSFAPHAFVGQAGALRPGLEGRLGELGK